MDTLNKLYVELTTACNLDCVMCVRRTWKNEGYGPMPWERYQRLISQLQAFAQDGYAVIRRDGATSYLGIT